MKFRKLIAAALAAMFCVTAAGCSGGNGSEAASGATGESAGEDVSTADEFDTSLTAMELTADIRIGWNLGNTLDATGGAGVSQETSWGNPLTTPELIQGVRTPDSTPCESPPPGRSRWTRTTQSAPNGSPG